MKFSVHWPGQMVFGAGQVKTVGEHTRRLGNRVFLVTTPELAALGVSNRVRRRLEQSGLTVTPHELVQADPCCLDVDQGAALARSSLADVVVAVGGGSAIDFGKGVAVATTHEGPVWDYVTYTGASAKPITKDPLPLVAIPTTAGTGAEVTQGAVLDNPQVQMKAALLHPRILPRVALIDPELTYSMPTRTTALTGFDTLTHGIEAFLNVERQNHVSDLFALEAVRLVALNLPRVIADPKDHRARESMCWAAAAGGMAIALSNAAVAHAMALPAGARLHAPHGLLLSKLQPVVLKATAQAQPDRCALLAEAVGASRLGLSAPDQAQALVQWLDGFVKRIGLDSAWNVPPVPPRVLDELTADVFGYMGRPIKQYRPVFIRTEVREMFEEALNGSPDVPV